MLNDTPHTFGTLIWIAGYINPLSFLTSKPHFNLLFSPQNLVFSPPSFCRTISIILQFSIMNDNQLALIAELVTPTIRADNHALAKQNAELRADIRQLLSATRRLADERATLIDQVHYLEGISERLMARVNLLEGQILDCDDPCHNNIRRIRRRLDYDSDNTVLETTELIELFSDSE